MARSLVPGYFSPHDANGRSYMHCKCMYIFRAKVRQLRHFQAYGEDYPGRAWEKWPPLDQESKGHTWMHADTHAQLYHC